MTKIFALAFLAMFALCLLCLAQTVTVNVVDQSTLECPVRLSGKIDLTESELDEVNRTSYVNHISATNLSNVPIVAMITFTQISNSLGPLVGENNQLDAFFAHDLEIAPGQTYTHGHQDNGVFSTPVPKGATTKLAAAATSQLVFVQFADARTCGDSSDGRVTNLMDTRADILLALKNLDDASKKGESEFLRVLALKSKERTRNAESVLDSIPDRQKQKGTANAIDYIHNMLAVAASR